MLKIPVVIPDFDTGHAERNAKRSKRNALNKRNKLALQTNEPDVGMDFDDEDVVPSYLSTSKLVHIATHKKRNKS